MVATIIRCSAVLMLLCGLLYHLAVTGIAAGLMPHQAKGSLIANEEGVIIGSEWIGQSFTDPGFFHGRISSIGYAADGSGSMNYAPSNPELLERVKQSLQEWKENNPKVSVEQLPVDLVTNSASGLDPHISIQSALVQVPRISEATGVPEDELKRLVEEHTQERELGLLGEPVVHVLQLNIALSGRLAL